MKRDSKTVLALAILGVGLLLVPAIGQTADFPSSPITVVVPYPAGGATDIAFRPLCEAARPLPCFPNV